MFHKVEKFPKQSIYSDQAAFVDRLPEEYDKGPRGQTLRAVAAKESPFATDSREIPAGVNVEVYHHSLSAPPAQPALSTNQSSPAANESDSDDDSQHTTAVVTRVLKVSGQSKKEKIIARLATSDNSTHSFTLKFNADGTIKSVKHSSLPMNKIKIGLFDAKGDQQAGVVVKAQDTTQRSLFTHVTKPK
jgi:hypothetical protein